MLYKDKGIKSKEAAILCYEKHLYDSCINRYYYSFYQYMLQKLADNKLTINSESLTSGSHINTFNEYLDNIVKKSSDYNRDDETLISSFFYTIKRSRKKADYETEDFSRNEVNFAILAYNQLIDYLKKY